MGRGLKILSGPPDVKIIKQLTIYWDFKIYDYN